MYKLYVILLLCFTMASCTRDRICTCYMDSSINDGYVGETVIPDATLSYARTACEKFEETWQANLPGTNCSIDTRYK